ncbi:unnamed protein product [Lactuca virosa]|uniref:Importin N-terminal domain-containing protein n=1 Tax=Lactuca virosa TaxID=75947 RepID=A0AAU9LQR5_9ASTR|nr:unnamed protein product [Lactuca virosa]
MYLPSLDVVLQGALSPNHAERKAAEESLNKYQYTPKHLTRLLHIIGDRNYDLILRQVACIHFKNFIAENWSPHGQEEQIKISPNDKHLVKRSILVFVEQVPTLLRVQLGECLKTIIHADYPEQWPSLLQWVTLNLQGQQVLGALFVLQILSRKYEFKSYEERTPIHHVVEETFPHLLSILNRLVHIENPSIKVAYSIKLICKTYWFSMFMEIPNQLFDSNVFNDWIILFLNILERPVPLEGQPADPDLRKSWGWWKVKKWTVHILHLVYTKYGDLKLQYPDNRAFAQHFEKKYAAKILECHLNLLNRIRVDNGGYLPERVTYLILQYLSNSISKAATYNLLQARLDVVLFEIIFPLMCFNDNDQKLWEEDPHEYVRKGYDIIEDYSPRTAALYFLSKLVKKSGKKILQKVILFILEFFKRYKDATIEIKPYRQKDGALLVIGALCDKLMQTEAYKSVLEQMLVQHVFPEFSSPVGHIRAKAAWVAGKYAHIYFSDPNNFCKALQSVIAGMSDSELPVRVDSVISLCSFVKACEDLDEMKPVLPQLLAEILKVMNEVENMDLVSTLETIVRLCEEEMEPYAVGLCQNLVAAFWKCMNTAEEDDEADDDRGTLAAGCLSAISTVLESVSTFPHLFAHIEPILLPIMRQTVLPTNGQEFDEVFDIVLHMTFSPLTISMDMWSLWPLLMEASTGWAIEYLHDIHPILENYICGNTVHYLTWKEPDYQQSLWCMLSKVMSEKNLQDENTEPAPMLMSLVLQNCRGHVDHWVESYIRITIERFHQTESHNLKCLLMQVIADALYYNASLTYDILQKLGVTREIFNHWFQLLQKAGNTGTYATFRSKNDKRVCCLGLTSLLSLADQLPEEVLGRVYKATLDLLVAYKDQVAEDKEETEEDDDMSDDFQTDDEVDRSDKEMGVDDYDDDISDDEDLKSSTDEVDPFVLFVDTMKVLQQSDAMRFEKLSQTLDLHYQALTKGVAQHVDEKRAAIEKEKLQKA